MSFKNKKLLFWIKGHWVCGAPFPGGPLTTRQPAETLVNVG